MNNEDFNWLTHQEKRGTDLEIGKSQKRTSFSLSLCEFSLTESYIENLLYVWKMRNGCFVEVLERPTSTLPYAMKDHIGHWGQIAPMSFNAQKITKQTFDPKEECKFLIGPQNWQFNLNWRMTNDRPEGANMGRKRKGRRDLKSQMLRFWAIFLF